MENDNDKKQREILAGLMKELRHLQLDRALDMHQIIPKREERIDYLVAEIKKRQLLLNDVE